MKHTILATIMLVALTFSAEAYDFQSGVLFYTITEGYTVEVTKDDSYSNLTSITIPNALFYEGRVYTVTGIGSNAFSGCSRLTSIIIPNDVKAIGSNAFSGCSRLTSITIPGLVKAIGENAFSGCNNLAILNYQGKIDGWLKISFGNAEANPLSITHHLYINNEEFTDLVIPDNITEIKSNAFYGCLGLTSVTIPNSVTSIGENAFTGCDNITTLTYNSNNIGLHFSRKSKLSTINIGDSVSNIYPFIFEGCSGLKSITIPNSVKAIGDYAFNGCSGLASVTIPNSVTSISFCAFYGCSDLASVTIPNSVKAIGDYAFNGCSGLASVTIPNSVTSIGIGAFRNVKHIVYNGSATGSPWGAITMNGIIDGDLVYTNAQKDTLIAYIGTGGDVAIPNSVTSICSNAFSNCSGLTSITIPNSVTSIGSNAFSGCSGLTSVTFAENSKLTSIEYYVFDGCSGLTSITIPNSVTSIGSNAFSNCSGLTSVNFAENSQLTSIGNGAFIYCEGLTSVTIPNSTTSIGVNAFYNCHNLEKVDYRGTIGDWLNISFSHTYANPLYYAHKLYINNEEITNVVIPDSITEIKPNAFYGYSGLTSVTISNSVTSIGAYAFAYSKLKSVIFAENSKLTSIGEYAFGGSSVLGSVTIPNSVTSIGLDAFKGIKHISYNGNATGSPWGARIVTKNGIADGDFVYTNDQKDSLLIYIGTGSNAIIPNSVTSIGEEAFYNCTNLTSVTIPNSVTSIGNYAFDGCSGLTSVTIPNSVTSIGNYAFDGCSGLTSVTIPNSVKSIGNRAFDGCSGLTSVTIPNSVTSIGDMAFINCSGLTSVTIPNSVTSIGYGMFSGCSGLTSITIPNSVTSIGLYAFRYCSGLTSVTFAKNSKLTRIDNLAFADCSGLTSVTIPNSVKSIGSDAFKGIKHISYNGNATGSPWGAQIVTKDAIADGDFVYTNDQKDSLLIYIGTDGNAIIPNSVTIICDDAFYDCTSLTSVNIPNSVKSIGNRAFYGCSGLTSVTIPNSVKSIGNRAFNGCSGLTSVTIPNSVTSIGYSAISDCSGLTSITIPNSVTSISDYAFDGCGGLTSITIPNSVTSIGNYAFRECTGLTSVSIPNSVTSIGKYAFDGCSGLTSVSIPNSVTSIGTNAFLNCTASIIYCQATEKPSGWNVNWNIDSRPVVWGCKAVSLSANDNTFGTVSGDGLFPTDSSINITAISAKHYHFVKWSDGDTENPRTIKVTADTTLIAMFAIDTLKVTASAENGTVSGTGAYTYGTQTSLTATPAEHYHFAKWNDGNTENPRSIKVTSDTTLIAVFAIDTFKVTASAENGTVLGAGLYAYGTSILLGAIPAEHYHFAKWNDGNTENPRTITVTENITLEAIFKKADAIDTLKVTASAENGTVFGAGEFAYGTSILLVATPAEHYHFAKWSDGNTENPRTITVTEDIALEAIFEKADDISTDAVSALAIYAHHNVIVVENADADIYIYDAMGRLVARRDVARNVSTEITMQDAGIYIVKVGNEAKRVAVSQN